MAPISTELATLRALTFRISSTPTAQLPQHVPAIATALANCKTLLSSTQTSNAKSSSEGSVAIHKYRTLLSTLLQDRTVQGRWSAIVLVKATIEVGGWETLQKCLPWVRGLLGILSKPDPPSSKKLCIITLARIFILTRDYPTLVREITTPSLPAFVQSCLQAANPKASKASPGLLQIVLECFAELLPRHPTIFRSYLKQIRPLLLRLVSPTPSTKLDQDETHGSKSEITTEVTAAARRLLVQLPCCAAKGASSDEWETALKVNIKSAHRVADKVFRAVLEDWQSTVRDSVSDSQVLDGEVQDLESDNMALPTWSGLYAGSERLTSLLRLIKEYLENPTTNAVTFRIGVIMDLLTRVLSLTVPASGGKAFQNTVRVNNQVSREERETLWLVLPGVHVAAIELLLAMANRLQDSTMALDTMILDQLVWVFGSEKDAAQVRTACYQAIASLLKRSGATLPKSSIDSLSPLIRSCCADLLPSENITATVKETPGQAKANGNSLPQATANADSFLNSSKSVTAPAASFIGLEQAAYDLLPVLLANIGAQFFSDSLRARLDRTAILTQHKDAMVASVLNPPPSKKFGKPAASILPLMARSFTGAKDVEGMLRPRMPVIRLAGPSADEDQEMAEEEMEEAEGEAESPEGEDDEAFVGQELDTLLESAGQAGTSTEDVAMEDASATEQAASQAAEEFGQSKDTGKRPHTGEVPLSPTKRVRFGAEERVAFMPPAVTVVASSAESSAVPATSDFTVTATASAIPDLPEPGDGAADGAESDDDDDDVVPLVFGQDTDDESD
jgi:pre-rRNA-processing protein RIX1